MPYTAYTLDSLALQLATLLDDSNERYWSRQEKVYAIWESMRVWGALTSYWRSRGTFNLSVAPNTSPFYDLSTQLPTLRTRTWTLGQLVSEIQYHLLEAANGIGGAGMSGQVTIDSILRSVQRARNRFVLDARFPISANTLAGPPSPQGMVEFPQTSVYVHRAAWQDDYSSQWTNLWREDAWALDHSTPTWPLDPGMPAAYSESENSPLILQLYPPPQNSGSLDILSVDSLLVDITNPTATFNVPDEWVHAIKYAALAELFSADSQINDPFRAQYAAMRYVQAIDAAKTARSIIRLLLGSVPLPIDSLAAIDSSMPFWRNQTGPPEIAGVLFDYVVFAPAVANYPYGVAADVVRSAPIPPTGSDPIPIGEEDIPHLIDYAIHILVFKCGGDEFKATFAKYDEFMSAVARRGNINKAKIRYLTAMFNQPEKEEAERPDRLETANA